MTKTEIGETMKRLREARGLSPHKVAIAITLTSGRQLRGEQVKSVESGDTAYTIDTLLLMCNYYGVTLTIG